MTFGFPPLSALIYKVALQVIVSIHESVLADILTVVNEMKFSHQHFTTPHICFANLKYSPYFRIYVYLYIYFLKP